MYDLKQIITYDTKLELFICLENEIEIISLKYLNLKSKTFARQ